MNFLEKDLEQIIFETENDLLKSKGIPVKGKKYRQLRIGAYGISDIVTVEKLYYEGFFPYLNITVYELKKDKVGIGAFLQSLKYCKGIKTYLETRKPNIEFSLNIILASKEVDISGDFIFLTDLIDNNAPNGCLRSIDFYSFKYEINGIVFNKEFDYNLTYKGF